MKIGIMQPYFLPYMGYFALIAKTDQWVVFDSSQYTKKTWMNRNRIMASSKEEGEYITVPVIKSPTDTPISQIQTLEWQYHRNKLLKTIQRYKKAPYFKEIFLLLEECFHLKDKPSLTELNCILLKKICTYLNLPFNYTISSKEKNLENLTIDHPGQWALRISQYYGASEYINPISGQHLFKKNEFDNANIKLSFLKWPTFKYNCSKPFTFTPNLSILDTLMWCSPDEIITSFSQAEIIST